MRLTVIAVLASFLAACTAATRIWIDPKEPVLKTPQERVQLVGHVMRGSIEDAKAPVQWTSSDPKIVSVDQDGYVRGISSGRTTVVAHYGNLSARVPVEVSFVQGLSAKMGSITLSYSKGSPIDPGVVPMGYDGRVLKDRTLTWGTDDVKICRPDGTGQVWPGEVGQTTVTATVEGHSVKIPCTVVK